MGNNDKNSKAGENEVILEFDDILVHVNGWGFYQWMLLIYTCCITVILSYAQNASVLILYEPPDFRCAKPSSQNELTGEELASTVACDLDDDMAKKCCMPKTHVRLCHYPKNCLISYVQDITS